MPRSLPAPTGDASPETWGTQEVGQWLLRVGVSEDCDLRQYVETFAENEVCGKVLQAFCEESDTGMLADLGVELGHRKLIQHAVQHLFARDARPLAAARIDDAELKAPRPAGSMKVIIMSNAGSRTR